MPLRGGSKSIPDKNIREIGGKPLFSWALGAALASGTFDEICVATDSEEIAAKVVAYFGDSVRLVNRSPEVSTDEASTEAVMLEFQANNRFDVICLIQATSPTTAPTDFVTARKQFENRRLDSLFSATLSKSFRWSLAGQPLNYDPQQRPRRQDFNGQFEENGAFYFTATGVLTRLRNRLGGAIGVYEMSAVSRIELDEPDDWFIVDQLLRRNCTETLAGRIEPSVSALVLDVDGTLTDAGMYYSEIGETLKRFDTRDAKGLEMLRSAGLKIAVITAETSPAVHARMRKLDITEYHYGIKHKIDVLTKLARIWQIDLCEIAYIGDDLGDLDCLRAVGFAICPNDAVPRVVAVADHVTHSNAGHGAVREACDYLLSLK